MRLSGIPRDPAPIDEDMVVAREVLELRDWLSMAEAVCVQLAIGLHQLGEPFA